MKKIILLVILSAIFLTGCTSSSLDKELEKMQFNVESSEVTFYLTSSKQTTQFKFKAIIKIEDDYVKTIKSDKNGEEINIVYKKDGKYYLNQTLSGNTTNEEITMEKAKVLYDEVQATTKNYYENLKPNMENVTNYKNESNIITYSETIDGVLNEFTLKSHKYNITEFTKVYTYDNAVIKANLMISYDFQISIPEVN